jgi:Tol biopolymer transport system component
VVGVLALPRVVRPLSQPLAALARLPERARAWLGARRVPKRDPRSELTGAEHEQVRLLARRLDGVIVWSSNRSGQHQLYLVDLRRQHVRQLTNTRNANTFPRVSPDGHRLVFMRSQQERASFRDLMAWDIYLINLDGTQERRLARNALHPAWTADGAAIVFHRATQVFRVAPATGQEELILDVARELPGIDDDAGDLELGPDGKRFAFVVRGTFAGAHGLNGPFSGATVLDPGAHALALLTREQACQTTWAPDGQSVLWMETGGNGGTRVMTGRPDGRERRILMDLPGARSHEYFPKLSNDGRWLAWGATAEGHEQDQANYEVFIWEVGTPWETAVQLTHHPGNSNWPDLWVRSRS